MLLLRIGGLVFLAIASATERHCTSAAPDEAIVPGNTTQIGSGDPTWGQIRGRFVYDGEVPKPAFIDHRGDKFPDERLFVDPRTRGVANVVVWLVAEDGAKLPIHPALKSSSDKVNLKITGGGYEPRIVVVARGQSVVIRNSGREPDNWRYDGEQQFVNRLLPAEEEFTLEVEQPERLPRQFSSSIRPFKVGYLVAQPHPYVAVTNHQGEFAFRDVPPGRRTFVFWHELNGYVKEWKTDAVNEKLAKGRKEFAIDPGANDWGELRVGAEMFLLRP